MRRTVTAAVVALTLGAALQVTARIPIAPCQVGVQAPAFGFWTWAPNSTIKVYILEADFKPEDKVYLLLPFENWNAVSEATGSGVKFEYAGAVSSALYCEACLTIMRGQVFDKKTRHVTELRSYSARHDQIMTWAHIVIDLELTNQNALTNAVAHELGHNFGLLDCYNCKPKTTVMNKLEDMNVSNGMTGPTECDVAQVRAAFRELAVRVRPAPKTAIVDDEGEEPVDDDTPIILKKP
jgi:hypothetical protein